MKVLFVVVIVFLLLLCAFYSFVGNLQHSLISPTPIDQRESTAVYAQGRIEGFTEIVEVRPQLRGQVENILVKENQIVTADEPLIELDKRRILDAINLAKKEIQVAELELQRAINGPDPLELEQLFADCNGKWYELDTAIKCWTRIKNLHPSKAASDEELDNSGKAVETLRQQYRAAKAKYTLMRNGTRHDDLAIVKARVELSKAKLRSTETDLYYSVVRSPISGKILKINTEVGNTALLEQEIIWVADCKVFQIRAQVEELDAPHIKLGMCCEASTDSGLLVTGKIITISPVMTNKSLHSDRPTERYDTKTREFWMSIDQKENYIIGLRVEVKILK